MGIYEWVELAELRNETIRADGDVTVIDVLIRIAFEEAGHDYDAKFAGDRGEAFDRGAIGDIFRDFKKLAIVERLDPAVRRDAGLVEADDFSALVDGLPRERGDAREIELLVVIAVFEL